MLGRAHALSVTAALLLASGALAQDQELPLKNWGAPPYWTPPVVAKEGGPAGAIEASAQGMTAQAQALPSSPLPFVAIAPCRIVDTRVAVADGFHEPNFSDGETRTFNFPASSDCTGLPATAGAYSLNVQYRPLTQLAFITLFPTGTTMPTVSTLTASPAAWVEDAAIVPAGTSGEINVYCQYAGRVIIDINGYYGPHGVVSSLTSGVTTLTGDVTLAQGSNVTITPSGNTFTIAATGGPGGVLPTGTSGQTLYNNGSAWTASSALTNDGYNVGITGNLALPGTTQTTGQISLGGPVFLHAYTGAGSIGQNTFLGQGAGNLTMSSGGTQNGYYASYNVGVGYQTLSFETTGWANSATGYQSLQSNTTGNDNTATGFYGLRGNTTGTFNTATGSQSLYSNTTGTQNTGVGVGSLYASATGSYNTGIGANSGNRSDTITGYDNVTPITFVPSSTGSWNTFVGEGTGATTQVDNCTAVGVDAYCTATNQVRLGNRFVGSIGGEVPWSALSDLRAKTDVRDISLGLDFVMALRPVEYQLKSGNGKTDMGFVAQDIEALLGDGYNVLDIGGDPERTLSLRHTDLIAPLVRAIQEQQATIAAETARIKAQQAEIEVLKQALTARDRDLERRLAALEEARR